MALQILQGKTVKKKKKKKKKKNKKIIYENIGNLMKMEKSWYFDSLIFLFIDTKLVVYYNYIGHSGDQKQE